MEGEIQNLRELIEKQHALIERKNASIIQLSENAVETLKEKIVSLQHDVVKKEERIEELEQFIPCESGDEPSDKIRVAGRRAMKRLREQAAQAVEANPNYAYDATRKLKTSICIAKFCQFEIDELEPIVCTFLEIFDGSTQEHRELLKGLRTFF